MPGRDDAESLASVRAGQPGRERELQLIAAPRPFGGAIDVAAAILYLYHCNVPFAGAAQQRGPAFSLPGIGFRS